MPRIAVFQHVAHEILGTFHPLLKDAGFRIRYVNYGRKHHDVLDMRRYDGLVILGGPMGVYEAERYPHLRDEIDVIKTAIDQDKPVLGICLGSQLLAAALGSGVRPAGVKEIGWFDVALTEEGRADPVLGRFKQSERVFQWHGDTYDLPKGAVRLASSAVCQEQAFRYGDKTYGLQFHLEVDEPMIERWLKIPANVEELAPLGGDELMASIRAANPVYLPRLQVASRQVFSGLVELFRKSALRGPC
jgi:GMP synthase (glutamine-hydrolysing)